MKFVGKWKPYRIGGWNPEEPRGKMKKKSKEVSQAKAKEILKDGTVHGKKLTKKQKGYFGAIAGGKKAKPK